MKTIIIALLAFSLTSMAETDPRIAAAILTMERHADQSTQNAYLFEVGGPPEVALYFKHRAESLTDAAQYLRILFADDLTNPAFINEPIHRTGQRDAGDTQDGIHERDRLTRSKSGLQLERAKSDALKSERRKNHARPDSSRH
jgi:hypothetical protein